MPTAAQTLMKNLYTTALAKPFHPAEGKLTNNLRVLVLCFSSDFIIEISRTDRYPGRLEWELITNAFPFPLEPRNPARFILRRMHILRGAWNIPENKDN
jgi:hypothetical protein